MSSLPVPSPKVTCDECGHVATQLGEISSRDGQIVTEVYWCRICDHFLKVRRENKNAAGAGGADGV